MNANEREKAQEGRVSSTVARVVGMLVLLACALAAAPAAAATPTVSVQEAITFWVDTFVSAGWQDGAPVYRDCYAFLEERVPPRLIPLAREMQKIGGYLMAEAAPQMGDPETFVPRLRMKSDWSPALRAMVRSAILRAGFVLPDAELVGTAEVEPDEPRCDTGRCDCVECSPHVNCDCKTVSRMEGLRPVACENPARLDCNVVSWKKPRYPEEVPHMATQPPVVGFITR